MLFERARQVSLRRFILFAADAACVLASFCVAAYVRLKPSKVWWTGYIQDHLPYLVCTVGIFLVVFYAGGLYERETLTRKSQSIVLLLITVAIGMLLSMAVFYAQLEVGLGRGILLISSVFIFAGTCLIRRMYRIAVGYGFLFRNALIVGDGEEVEQVLDLIQHTEDSGFKIYGIVSSSRTRKGEFSRGVPILGPVEALRKFVEAYEVETIILAATQARESTLLSELRPLRYAGIQIMDYVSLHEQISEEIPIDHIDDEWLMNAAMKSSAIHIRKIKRMMDIVVSLAGLVVTLPVTALAALFIWVESGGPVLFRQRRASLAGRPYTLIKFRTMKADAEVGSGPVWAGRFDERVTRCGRILRKWRIDEIPQLVNVLRGEMSLVGPRPERPEFIESLAEQIPFYKERLMVPPGITGWAQVKFPYAASVDAARRKLQYDLYYNKHMGFLLDVQILLRTFRTIFEGTHHSEEEPGRLPDESEGLRTKHLTVIPPPAESDDADDKSA
jgi:exopolysaccharide biosynthesis polyprenyl glycosylphosphotransferase